jgi:hypothetical protein
MTTSDAFSVPVAGEVGELAMVYVYVFVPVLVIVQTPLYAACVAPLISTLFPVTRP